MKNRSLVQFPWTKNQNQSPVVLFSIREPDRDGKGRGGFVCNNYGSRSYKIISLGIGKPFGAKIDIATTTAT
jgi:hypothetical protein